MNPCNSGMVASSITTDDGAGVEPGVGVGLGLGCLRRRRLARAADSGRKALRPEVTSAALVPAAVRKNSRRVVGLCSGAEGVVIVGRSLFIMSPAAAPGPWFPPLPTTQTTVNKYGASTSQFE